MYVYSGLFQAKPGKTAETGAQLVKVRDAISAAIDSPVSAWSMLVGPAIGGFGLSTRVDGLQGVADLQAAVADDAAYADAAAGLADVLAGPAQVVFARVVATTGEMGPAKPVTMVTSVMAKGGHLSEAMDWANEIMGLVKETAGLDTMLAMSAAGSPGTFYFSVPCDSPAAADAGNRAVVEDPRYGQLMDKAGGILVDGSAQRLVMSLMA